jgi:hypothetical protein
MQGLMVRLHSWLRGVHQAESYILAAERRPLELCQAATASPQQLVVSLQPLYKNVP